MIVTIVGDQPTGRGEAHELILDIVLKALARQGFQVAIAIKAGVKTRPTIGGNAGQPVWVQWVIVMQGPPGLLEAG